MHTIFTNFLPNTVKKFYVRTYICMHLFVPVYCWKKEKREDREMEAAKSIVENGKTRENENVGFEDDVDVDSEEDEENLKRRISSHPLYGLLIETHFNCLKVGLGEIDVVGTTNTENKANLNLQSTINPTCSELDRFMEAYYIALKKLKAAMEEPLQESTSFIEETYIQLRELSETTHPNNPKPNSATH